MSSTAIKSTTKKTFESNPNRRYNSLKNVYIIEPEISTQ